MTFLYWYFTQLEFISREFFNPAQNPTYKVVPKNPSEIPLGIRDPRWDPTSDPAWDPTFEHVTNITGLTQDQTRDPIPKSHRGSHLGSWLFFYMGVTE